MIAPTATLLRLAPLVLSLALVGCEKAMQDMYRQPRYDPLEPSTLFPDGSSARTPVAGTLAAIGGRLADASGGRRGTQVPALYPHLEVFPVLDMGTGQRGGGAEVRAPAEIPFPLTVATYRRGRERFDIYCAPCHSVVGDGDGMVVRRGFPAPPSYHTDRLRGAPDRHFYAVITRGYGAMYSYADRLSPGDRWAVVAYIRALQLSRHTPLSELSAQERARLEHQGGGHG
jgi:mono/diheme cytochrome c family protein